jgi:dihydrofolate reductase
MTISLIAAVAEGGVIGRSGGLPWRLPADLARFKRLTMGHTLIVGRRTYQSIGSPLPGRTLIVLTRTAHFRPAGVGTASSLEEALQRARRDKEVFIAGGEDVYRQALPLANRLYLTRVGARLEGDTFFPDLDGNQWILCEESHRAADQRNAYPMIFQVFQRRDDTLCGRKASDARILA